MIFDKKIFFPIFWEAGGGRQVFLQGQVSPLLLRPLRLWTEVTNVDMTSAGCVVVWHWRIWSTVTSAEVTSERNDVIESRRSPTASGVPLHTRVTVWLGDNTWTCMKNITSSSVARGRLNACDFSRPTAQSSAMKLCHIKRDHPVHVIMLKMSTIGRNARWLVALNMAWLRHSWR